MCLVFTSCCLADDCQRKGLHRSVSSSGEECGVKELGGKERGWRSGGMMRGNKLKVLVKKS